MTHKTQPTAHAEITAPISADLRGIEQEARELPEPSPTAGMNLGQRILHVGGRENAAGYIEFGSVAAVRALVGQVLRDMQAAPPAPAAVAVPDGFALVPKRLTRAMERVLTADEEGWQWEDLLAAAEAITEQEYAALAAAPAQAVAAPEVVDTEIDWDQLPEDAGERAMFDRNLDLYGGDPRIAIATALSIWANTRANGSFARMCAVLANEVAKLRLAAAPAHAVAVPAFEAVRMFWAQHGSQSVLDMSTLAELHSDVERTIRQHAPAQEHARFPRTPRPHALLLKAHVPAFNDGWRAAERAHGITGAAQEHATQLAGQGQDKP